MARRGVHIQDIIFLFVLALLLLLFSDARSQSGTFATYNLGNGNMGAANVAIGNSDKALPALQGSCILAKYRGNASMYNPQAKRNRNREGGNKVATGGHYNKGAYQASLNTRFARRTGCGNRRKCLAVVSSKKKSLLLEINDVGPFYGSRTKVIDLNYKSAVYFGGVKEAEDNLVQVEGVTVTLINPRCNSVFRSYLGPLDSNKIKPRGEDDASTASSAKEENNRLTNRELQKKLKEAGLYKGEIDGIIGPQTRAAIREFQKGVGITVDGIAGPETMSALNDNSGVYAGSFYNNMEIADDFWNGRNETRALQQQLKYAGFDPGRIDGLMGARTRSAIREFQRRVGLKVDGIAGVKTKAALSRIFNPVPGTVLSPSSQPNLTQRDYIPTYTYTNLLNKRVRGMSPSAPRLQGLWQTGRERNYSYRYLTRFFYAPTKGTDKPSLNGLPNLGAGLWATLSFAEVVFAEEAGDESTNILTPIFGLNPSFSVCLASFLEGANASGFAPRIVAGYRSAEEQQKEYYAAKVEYGERAQEYAREPDNSEHVNGIAVDFDFSSQEEKDWLYKNAIMYGLRFNLPGRPGHLGAFTNFCAGVGEESPYAYAIREYEPNKIELPEPEVAYKSLPDGEKIIGVDIYAGTKGAVPDAGAQSRGQGGASDTSDGVLQAVSDEGAKSATLLSPRAPEVGDVVGESAVESANESGGDKIGIADEDATMSGASMLRNLRMFGLGRGVYGRATKDEKRVVVAPIEPVQMREDGDFWIRLAKFVLSLLGIM